MKLHIYGILRDYKRRRTMRMHMPGHKSNRRHFPLFKDAALDITELSFSDCLENPDGVIALAERDIASVLGAEKSHILTDGSSCGVFAMLYAVKCRGGKVVIARNSHKSVYNACAVLGIEPVVLKNNENNGILLPPGAADIESALKKEKDACAVLLTSPDYFGNIADYAAVRKICDRYGKMFLVDGAHGAYLRFDADAEGLYAGNYADIWVDGAHKTLPSLTQGAILNVGKAEFAADIEEGLDLFRTTSPSYPVMASVEYGVKYMQECGAELIDAVRSELVLLKAKLKKRGIGFYTESRTLVLAVDFGGMGISSQAAREELEKRNVYAEMDDGRYVLFYFSPLTPPREVAALDGKIRQVMRLKALKNTYEGQVGFVSGIKKFGYLTSRSVAYERVPLAQAAGRIAARNAGVTPPCYPVVLAGEQITPEAVEVLSSAKHTFGITGGTIPVMNIGGRT